jgi:hypothetical protein
LEAPERLERCQSRIDLAGLAPALGDVSVAAADRAEPATLGAAEGFHRQREVGLAPEEPSDVENIRLVEVDFQVVPAELGLRVAAAGLRHQLQVHLGLDLGHEGFEAPAARQVDGRLEAPGDRDLLCLPLDSEIDGVQAPARLGIDPPDGRRIE